MAPLFDASLQYSQQPVRELAKALGTKTQEQLLGGSIGFRFQPAHHAGPHFLDRVASRSPVTLLGPAIWAEQAWP